MTTTGIGGRIMPTSRLAYAGTPYQVLDHDGTEQPPPLPDGHGAVAVYTWCQPIAQKYTTAPMVGVDGKPASYGWGHVLIVLPVGEHLVEVQYIRPMRTIQVNVTSGQIVPVEYAAAADGGSPGAIGHGPQRPPGRAYSPVGYILLLLGMSMVFNGGLLGLHVVGWFSGGPAAVVAAVTVLVGILGGIAVYRHQQRPGRPSDRRQGR